MQASYTWSKDLGDMNSETANASSGNSGDPTNLSQQYGPVYFNHPQRFIINYAYDLPFGQHQGFLGKVLEGWNVSGVTTVQGGTPLTITDAAGGTIFGTSTSRAEMCPGATYGSALTSGSVQSKLNDYVSLGAFCTSDLPTIGNGTGYGNSGVGILLGPGQFNFDFSLVKTTRITERQALIFRAEAFNLFNHPQFLNPSNLAVSTPGTFGEIIGSSVNPRILQLALKYIF
jgi:hypothetical protein